MSNIQDSEALPIMISGHRFTENSHELFKSRVFLKFNTPEASSARSERLYSGGKLVLETKRNRLGDDNFEKLLLLELNKNL